MNLTPDTLYTVALNLSGKELLNMCSVNRETRRICMSERFNPIWSKKLYEDYSIQYKGKDGYNKYLESTYFYHQKYWVATISYNREIIESALFRDRESGILFLVNKIKIKRDTVDNLISMFLILNSNSSYEGYTHKYEIQETFSITNLQEKTMVIR